MSQIQFRSVSVDIAHCRSGNPRQNQVQLNADQAYIFTYLQYLTTSQVDTVISTQSGNLITTVHNAAITATDVIFT
ncbi:MAG: hypothetical protein AAF572_02630 [Cyanobacteria bacterium P01_B01_bin.77]